MPIPVNPPAVTPTRGTYDGYLWVEKGTVIATVWFNGTYYHYKATTPEEISKMVSDLTDVLCITGDMGFTGNIPIMGIKQILTREQVIKEIKNAVELESPFINISYCASKYGSKVRNFFKKQEMTFAQAKNFMIKFGKYGKDKPQTVDQIAQIDLRYLDWLRGDMEKKKEANKNNPTFKALCVYLDDPSIQRELDNLMDY